MKEKYCFDWKFTIVYDKPHASLNVSNLIIDCHDLTHSSWDYENVACRPYITVQQAENAGLLLVLGFAQSYTHALLAVACESSGPGLVSQIQGLVFFSLDAESLYWDWR